ncbi:MAG: Bug family tripartite tricarboxylate transporter substrate binding protein [Lautropia sp.]
MQLRRRFLASVGSAGLAAVPWPAWANTSLPARTVRLISPFPPGGGVDATARLIAVPLAEALGQSVVVENRTGASGSIGAAEVARAAPDGTTLLMDSFNHVVNPSVLRDLTFDYRTAFVPISKIVRVPLMVIVHPSSPAKTLGELVDYIKARPRTLSYGSAGVATASHLCALLLTRQAGLDIVHVPYRGGPLALQDVLGNRLTMMISAAPYTLPMARDGRVRVLAVTTPQRVPSLPDVPTFAEAGFGDARVDEWNGLFAPAGTPPETIARLYGIVREALASPEMQRKFDGMSVMPLGSDPATFAQEVRTERETIARLVRDARIEIN